MLSGTWLKETVEVGRLVGDQFRLIGPYWVAGLAVGAWLSLDREKLARLTRGTLLATSSPLLRLGLASLAGALSPVTLFGVIPVLAALGREIVGADVLAAFVITSVIINPNVFIYSFALGPGVALLRLALALLAGLGGGLLIRAAGNEKGLIVLDGFAAPRAPGRHPSRAGAFASGFLRSLRKTGPNLALGILATALFDKYFPHEILDLVFLGNRPLSVLFAAGLSVPVYYCGGGTIPLIRAWMDAGMSLGAATSFMMVGPPTRFTNLGAVRTITSHTGFALYVAYSIVFGVLAGLAISSLGL